MPQWIPGLIVAPAPLPVCTLSKKFAIDHHSSLNCFANCFQQYSPSPSIPFSSTSHCLCFPFSFFFSALFFLRVLTSRFLSPLPLHPSPCPCPLHPLFCQPHPLAEQRAASSASVFATLPKFDEFLFYSFGPQSQCQWSPHPHSSSSPSPFETLPRDFVLFILLFTLLSQLARPASRCCCCCCSCCVLQHFSNQSAPSSAPSVCILRPFKCGSLITQAVHIRGRGLGSGNTINQCDLNMNLLKLHFQTFILLSFLFGMKLLDWRKCAARRLQGTSFLRKHSNLSKHNLKFDFCDTQRDSTSR